ncbi:MAG TPA: toxin-antitoxin system HicB family antitoxin [Jatrophihabitantaceae bacterium]|jgi:hypothetical protein
MQLQPYVAQVQAHLAAAAALGDERTKQTAEALAAAAEPALRLAVLAAVTAAADDITAALLDSPGAPAVAVRIDGEDLRIEVRTPEPAAEAPAAPAAPEDADASARISLRLSESLKSDIEAAARGESVSVNTWIVRVASRALLHQSAQSRVGWEVNFGPGREAGSARNAHHITGWING